MISQPMSGKTNAEIIATKEKATTKLNQLGYDVVNTFFVDEWFKAKELEEQGVIQIPLILLAKAVEKMACCRAVYFCKDWEKSRGCTIEHEIAYMYGLDIIKE